MEIGPCPACGGPLAPWRWVAGSDPALGQTRFELARCSSCGSAVTLGALPAGLYESGAYRPGPPRLQAAAQPLLRLFDRQRMAQLRSLAKPPARLLDAGAGRGRFVAAALGAGYDAFGIEPSDRGDEDARGARIERARIEDAVIEPGSLDVATLWHVLEHLDDPGPALGRIAGWLRPGGGLLVGVPNLASLQARLGGDHWYHLDIPRHRVHYTPTGIRVLLGSAGFSVLGIRHALLEHNPFGMWQSLLSRISDNPSYVYNLLKRNAPLRSRDLALAAAALPLAPVAAGLEAVAAAAGRGGTIAVLARRSWRNTRRAD